jgi:hypothetical protein
MYNGDEKELAKSIQEHFVSVKIFTFSIFESSDTRDKKIGSNFTFRTLRGNENLLMLSSVIHSSYVNPLLKILMLA